MGLPDRIDVGKYREVGAELLADQKEVLWNSSPTYANRRTIEP